MKKLLLACVAVVSVGACSHPHGYANYPGGYNVSAVHYAVCQPVNADALMSWAKGLDPSHSYHERDAIVQKEGPYVRCSSYERAGSTMGPARWR